MKENTGYIKTAPFLKMLHACVFQTLVNPSKWNTMGCGLECEAQVPSQALSKRSKHTARFWVIYSQFRCSHGIDLTGHEDEITIWLRKLNIHWKENKIKTEQWLL